MLRWGSNTPLNPAKLSLWYFTVSIELWTNLRGINTSKLIQYPTVFFIGLVIESLNNKTDLLTIYHFFSFICPLCSGVTSMSLVVSSYCLFTVNIIRRVLHCLLICFLHWWVMTFVQVEAEEQPEISEAHGVSAVPYFVFYKVFTITELIRPCFLSINIFPFFMHNTSDSVSWYLSSWW